MDKPLTRGEWEEARAKIRAEGWKLSNCFFLPAVLDQKIGDGVLFLHPVKNGLLLLEECGSFVRCYYYLSPTGHTAPPGLLREAVAEFPFNGEMNQNQLLGVERLGELGFTLGRQSGLMTCKPSDLVTPDLPEGDAVRPAEPGEGSQAAELFCASFDPRYAFLPDEEELAGAARDGRLLVIAREGKVAAALHAGFEKSVASIRHLAVSPRFRGTGMGKRLLCAYHRRFAKEAAEFRHWVDVNNVPAVSMYRGFGYVFGLRKANEYIYSPQKN